MKHSVRSFIKLVTVLAFPVLCMLVILQACSQDSKPISNNDPLPSWNEGKTKSSIIKFVSDVTNEQNPGFIPVEDRIATFDNDGNLWSEQPMYFQILFAMDRIKEMAVDHPEWDTLQPFKAVIENDTAALLASGMHGLGALMMTSHAGMTSDEFAVMVKSWMSKTTHPRFKQPYNNMIYQPMLELLDYLRANDFKTFIVSGGGIEFMRTWVTEAYGIPSDQVVGSTLKTEFVFENGSAEIMRLPEVDFNDDKGGKPVAINRFIGKRPVFASGNSDGDLQMLQYTDGGKGKRFMLYLHHTDEVREYAYDRDSHIGKLDKGLDYAMEHNWTIIDMKKDWKVIYPFQVE